MNRSLSGSLVAVVLVVILACPNNPPNYPTGVIELHYYANGSWPVTSSESSVPCDSQGNKCVFFYPSNLGANGFLHPILTWGNGSFGTPQQASIPPAHGVVGVSSSLPANPMTGPDKPFSTRRKYMAGGRELRFHQSVLSQTERQPDRVLRTFPGSHGRGQRSAQVERADQDRRAHRNLQIWGNSTNFFNPANLTGSIFFVDGSADFISPPKQGNNVTGLQSIDAFYQAVPNSVAKVKGTLIGPSHNDLGGQPSCAQAPVPCVNGVYGYLGYPTAWFMDRLQGDGYAHGAFVNSTGEMFSETTNWEYVASNIP